MSCQSAAALTRRLSRCLQYSIPRAAAAILALLLIAHLLSWDASLRLATSFLQRVFPPLAPSHAMVRPFTGHAVVRDVLATLVDLAAVLGTPYYAFCAVPLPAGSEGGARERWRRLLLATYGLSARLAGWGTPLHRAAADLEGQCAAQMRTWRRRLAEREMRECIARRRVQWRDVCAIMDILQCSAPVSADGLATDTLPGSAEEAEAFLDLECDEPAADDAAAAAEEQGDNGGARPAALLANVFGMALHGAADARSVEWEMDRQLRLCSGGAAASPSAAARAPPRSKAWSRQAQDAAGGAAGEEEPRIKQHWHKEGRGAGPATDAAEGSGGDRGGAEGDDGGEREGLQPESSLPDAGGAGGGGAAEALPALGQRGGGKGRTRRVRELLEEDGWCASAAFAPPPPQLSPLRCVVLDRCRQCPQGLVGLLLILHSPRDGYGPAAARREFERMKKHVIFKRRVIDPVTGKQRTQTFAASTTPSDRRTKRNQRATLGRMNEMAGMGGGRGSGAAAAGAASGSER